MNGGEPKLLVYLPFEAIVDGKVLDASGQGRDGVVHGSPRVVPDARLGSCLAFGGGTDAIELPASCFPGGAGVTVSFWAPGGLATTAASLFEAMGMITRVQNMAFAVLVSPPGTVSLTCGATGVAPSVTSRAVVADEAKAAWAHWAFTRDAAGKLTIYRDGVTWHAVSVSSAAIPAANNPVWLGTQIGGGEPFVGKMANFRIYDQAQTPQQVAQDIQDDQSAVASFRRSYPLDFGVHNDQMQQVLYITDDPDGHPMHVHVTNASGRVIQLVAPAAGTSATADNYHLALRFRPGTLSATFLATAPESLRAAVRPLGWDSALGHAPDGTDSLYFLATAGATLDVDRSVQLTVPNLSADGNGGARGTRVQLDFRGLVFAGDPTPVTGSRVSYLSILNQTGAREAPLHAGFVGDGDVLNDGASKTNLDLRITNTSPDRPLTLNPTTSPAPTRIILSFDVQADHQQKEWALATTSEAAAVSVGSVGPGQWDWRAETGGQTAEWILSPRAPLTVAAGDAIGVSLTGVSSSLPCGEANLYVRYENLPGYWDGERIATVLKTPIVHTPQGKVGIGTPTPTAKLTVSAGDTHAQLRREAGAATGGTILFLELYQEISPADAPAVYPAIRFHHFNRFWHRIEARPEGIHFMTGDTKSDGHVDVYAAAAHLAGDVYANTAHLAGDVYANTAHLDGSVTLGATNAIQQGFNFQVASGTPSKTHGDATWGLGYATGGLRIVGENGGVLATKDRDVLLWKPDDHDPAIGNVLIKGSLWARDKYFRIAHPTDPDRDLVHACLEGPESAVYYRGEGRLRDGRATVHLPEYFEALTRKEGRTVMLTARGREPFLLSYEDVEDGAFRVHGTRADGAFAWEVRAVRADVGPLEVEVAR